MQETNERPTILIVDEVPAIIRILELELGIQGYKTAGCRVGEDTLRALDEVKPDAIILELVLPGLNGLEVLRKLKERSKVPILILTTVDSEADRAQAFDLGADDYMIKPFDPLELGRRIGSLLQVGQPERWSLQSGGLVLDMTRQIARRGQLIISLTTNEWAILIALASRRGEPVPFEELATIVAGEPGDLHPSLLWPLITRMRRTLEEDPANPRIILGDPGQGLRLGVAVTIDK